MFEKSGNEASETNRLNALLALGKIIDAGRNLIYNLIEPIFIRMLHEIYQPSFPENPETLTQALELLKKLTYPKQATLPHITAYLLQNFHFVEHLVGFVADPCPHRKEAACILLGNLIVPDREPDNLRMTDLILHSTDYLELLFSALGDPNTPAQHVAELGWSIINILQSNANLESVLSQPNFVKLVELAKIDDEDVKLEATWTLANAAWNENLAVHAKLVECGIVEAFCQNLPLEDLRHACLNGLGGLLEQAEKLVDNENILFNPVAIQIAELGAVKLLKKDSSTAAAILVEQYFGEAYKQFLCRRRGLNTKKAT